MENIFTKGTWNPYAGGVLTGLLAILSVLVTTLILDKPEYLGTSTSFVRAAGYIEQTVAKEAAAENAYYQKTKIKVDWQMMLVAGIFVGALISSLAGKCFKVEHVPPIWKERFGDRAAVRAIGAFAGGVVVMFGVRMAGGCPSGHGLSGMMQLSVSGLIAMAGFLAGGIITAHLLYNRKSERG